MTTVVLNTTTRKIEVFSSARDVQARTDITALRGYGHDSVAALEAANVPAVVLSLTLRGYAAPGDGGGALYQRVGSEPSHDGKIQSADGAWWELASTNLHVRMLGAKCDGVADDRDALARAISVARATGLVIEADGALRIASALPNVGGVATDAPITFKAVSGHAELICDYNEVNGDFLYAAVDDGASRCQPPFFAGTWRFKYGDNVDHGQGPRWIHYRSMNGARGLYERLLLDGYARNPSLMRVTGIWNLRNPGTLRLEGGGVTRVWKSTAGITFSATAGTDILTASAAHFEASCVGQRVIVMDGGKREEFLVTQFDSDTQVRVTSSGDHIQNSFSGDEGRWDNILCAITSGNPEVTLGRDIGLDSSFIGTQVIVIDGRSVGSGATERWLPLRTTITAISGATVTLADAPTNTLAQTQIAFGVTLEIDDEPNAPGQGTNDNVWGPIQLEKPRGIGLAILCDDRRLFIPEIKIHPVNPGLWPAFGAGLMPLLIAGRGHIGSLGIEGFPIGPNIYLSSPRSFHIDHLKTGIQDGQRLIEHNAREHPEALIDITSVFIGSTKSLRSVNHCIVENNRGTDRKIRIGHVSSVGHIPANITIGDFVAPRYEARAAAAAERLFDQLPTTPGLMRSLLIRETIWRLLKEGVWDDIDHLYMLAADSRANAKVEWTSPGVDTLTEQDGGNLTFTADRGFSGNGTSSFLNTDGTLMSQFPLYRLNSASMWSWSLTDVLAAQRDIGANDQAFASINSATGGGNMVTRANAGGGDSVAVGDSLGLSGWSRRSSTGYDQFRNATLLASPTQVTTQVPTVTLAICKGALDFSTRQLAIGGVGRGLTADQWEAMYEVFAFYLGEVGAI